MTDDFATSVTDEDGRRVVCATGELDASTGPKLWDVLDVELTSGRDTVVLDLAGVRFIDSTGLSVVLRAHKALQSAGGKIVLRSPQPQTRQLLELSALIDILAVED